jgi:hypothetical protein
MEDEEEKALKGDAETFVDELDSDDEDVAVSAATRAEATAF